jgi:hypothetical protein
MIRQCALIRVITKLPNSKYAPIPNVYLIRVVYFDHLLELLKCVLHLIPEIRSERRDLPIFIFILKTTGTFTPVHSAGYLIFRNELRCTQEVARQNIQVPFYIQSMGLWPNTWIHVLQSLANIRYPAEWTGVNVPVVFRMKKNFLFQELVALIYWRIKYLKLKYGLSLLKIHEKFKFKFKSIIR